MIYGESGVGKTFVALDMACCVAAGLQWHGIRAAAGVVVYLAGEGNYGMRQRVAAWCVKNGILKLDNLLISNKAIDLDAPDSAARVIAAVRELTSDPVAAIYVDTLNNHMSGDENAARDTRAMINSCNVVASALGAAIVLVHHTGHGAESKQRARGSSAWRGALDASILVSGTTTEITLTCTKMKDAQAPSDLHGCLAPVDLGWFDEDGQSLPGAVFEMFPPGDLRNPQPKGDKLADHRRALERAWFAGGAEMLDGKPYVSREAFKGWMLEQGIKESSADQMLKASGRTGNIVRDLTDAKILQKFESGWQVVDRELIVKFVP
jgi:hypothetical protein